MLLVLIAAFLDRGIGGRQLQPTPVDISDEVAARIRRHCAARLASGSALDRLVHTDLHRLYATSSDTALWVDSSGRPREVVREALALLQSAAVEGLDPDDYDGLELASLVVELESSPHADQVAAFDLRLSANVLRYMRHIHRGRVDPREVGLQLRPPPITADLPVRLRRALEYGQIGPAIAALSPRLSGYHELRAVLARYRQLAAGAAVPVIPPSARAMRPGDRDRRAASLRRLLVALGDLADESPPADAELYEGSIVDGVKRFQIRHGLHPDGVVGSATQAALNVPMRTRARQIELAMERLRWVSDDHRAPVIVVNIPMFSLSGWDGDAFDGPPAIEMRAIVGKAVKTETPVVSKQLQAVVFRPYWNIPASIVRNEIMPEVRRDPGYLRHHNMEIVRGGGDDALSVPADESSLALLERKALRLRQVPGAGNALGLIKFVFPNDDAVYLHGTPTQKLFARARRDFSHGCVRVEDPESLAEWVLQSEPEWNRDRIIAATLDTRRVSRSVAISRTIHVLLSYTTAVVMTDGTVHFADDIYGHDAELRRALAHQNRGQ
jgi:murein L,D-transpeptidase YcbB/YkuD